VTWKHTQGLFSHKNVSFLVLTLLLTKPFHTLLKKPWPIPEEDDGFALHGSMAEFAVSKSLSRFQKNIFPKFFYYSIKVSLFSHSLFTSMF
jgi:hypothetical protein